MLDHVLPFKGEAKISNTEIVTYHFYKFAHNGSGFDSYVVLNNLPQWRIVVKLVKNGSRIVSLKILNGYVNEKKKYPNKLILDVVEFILIIRWKT